MSTRQSIVMVISILLATVFFVSLALACQFDTDCEPGSKCLKANGALYGVCAGGLSPGNKNDQVPVYDPLDSNETVGKTCSFDIDCGPGSICYKPDGGINGVCLKRR